MKSLFKYDSVFMYMEKSLELEITAKAIKYFDDIKLLIKHDFPVQFYPTWDHTTDSLKVYLMYGFGTNTEGNRYFYVDGLSVKIESVEIDEWGYYGDVIDHYTVYKSGKIRVLQYMPLTAKGHLSKRKAAQAEAEVELNRYIKCLEEFEPVKAVLTLIKDLELPTELYPCRSYEVADENFKINNIEIRVNYEYWYTDVIGLNDEEFNELSELLR